MRRRLVRAAQWVLVVVVVVVALGIYLNWQDTTSHPCQDNDPACYVP